MINLTQTHFSANRSGVLSDRQRSTHTYVIGQPGTGKSRALESWIMQDILAGRGVGVIDPHGDLFSNILARLSFYPQVWERIVIVDPLDPDWVMSVNPLEWIQGIPPERTASFMTDVMMKIWQLDITNAPRMLWLITNSFLALTLSRSPLGDIVLFLGDKSYRQNALSQINNDQVLRYFNNEFPDNPEVAREWISPALNKLGAMLFDPDVRPMLSGEKPLNLRNIMDNQQVLLVNIPKGHLGEGTSSLLGAFLLARMQSAALSRANTQNRPSFYLYMDEFQNYTTDNVKDILAESRKYSLSITFAHQYLAQLNDELRNAVTNTAGIIIAFRVGYQDAKMLVNEIFPVGVQHFALKPKIGLKQRNLWPVLTMDFQEEDKTQTLQLLVSLQHREFWVKTRSELNPSKHRSFDMPDVPDSYRIRDNVAKIRHLSGKTFGISKYKIKQSAGNRKDKSIPFWDR